MNTKNNPGPHSCYAKAEPDEPMFVLLARDPLAADLVRELVERRRNSTEGRKASAKDRAKLVSAMACANDMDEWWLGHPL